jgi:hypothetical protein
MEIEKFEKVESFSENQREALVYSYEIVNAALQNGWDIKIFQRDINLRYLYSILLDIDVDPNAFFKFDKFSSKEGVKSAYDWAREIQKEAQMEDINIGKLDRAYKEEIQPWDALSNKELVELNEVCTKRIESIYSLE